MTIILDNINILPALGETLKIERYYSPVMLNIEPYDEVTLFMEWETNFFNDYTDSSASSSSFEYGNTDYTYNGEKKAISRLAAGSSVLTPHGINNFNNKLEKYIKDHPDEKDIDILKNLMEEIRDKPAISQNLGGFTTNLAAARFRSKGASPFLKTWSLVLGSGVQFLMTPSIINSFSLVRARYEPGLAA